MYHVHVGKKMEYKIVDLPSFIVGGMKLETTSAQGRCGKDIAKAWRRLIFHKKERERLLANMDTQPYGLIGMSVYQIDPEDSARFDYYIGVATIKTLPDMKTYRVAASTWAVFPCVRKELKKVETQIIQEWNHPEYEIINTGYEQGNILGPMPDLEIYGKGNDVEVWIAIQKKVIADKHFISC